MRFYLVYENNGLYNLVLDDQEPIYYEPGDLDPQSQPTEVFTPQKFVEPEDLGSSLLKYGPNGEPLGTPYDFNTLGPNIDPLGTPLDPSILLTDRSLTASPFIASTKPYRPFSTEPIPEVPGIEEPIILNPDYKDEFGKSLVDIIPDYILNGVGVIESKFKLPISEQYDPDGTKRAKNAEIDKMLSKYTKMETLSKISVATDEKVSNSSSYKSVKISEISSKDVKISKVGNVDRKEAVKQNLTEECQLNDVRKGSKKTTSDVSTKEEIINKEESFQADIEVTEKHGTTTEAMEEKLIKEELKSIEKMKQEVNVSEIEETAVSIVNDSIERAVSVAEEIKKEIEEETFETVDSKIDTNEMIAKSEKTNKESAELIKDKVTESHSEKIDVTVSSKNVQISKEDTETNINEIQSTRVVKQISDETMKADAKATFDSSTMSTEKYKQTVTKEMPTRKESVSHAAAHSENNEKYRKVTKTVTSDVKSDTTTAQQRTYALGLQTIPNIRGVTHSSYHYDLLLRTFFLHLTDVMVALSRFLLTQPIFNTESSATQKTVSENQVTDFKKSEKEVVQTVKQRNETAQEKRAEERKEVALKQKKQEKKTVTQKAEELNVQDKKMEKRVLVTPVPHEMKVEEKKQKAKIEQEIKTDYRNTKNTEKLEVRHEQKTDEVTIVAQAEEKKVSGAQIAQRTEKKLTKEVTQKMDAVISEFQTIAVEEDKKEMLQRNRRSRSRSQIEEEVAKESDPLEWLSKVNSSTASQEISEDRLSKKKYSFSAVTERNQYEKIEKQEVTCKKAKKPKQMYLAVVEAHVYTNKNVIFEDAAEFSETSSVQSADETNTAFEASEAVSTENVALENAVQQIEQAKITEESQELSTATTQNAATIQVLEEVVRKSTDIKQEEYKQESAVQKTEIQEVVVQETKEIIEPVIDIKENLKKESAAVNINQSLSVAESSEINIQETKNEFTCIENKIESVASQKIDVQETIVQEFKNIVEPVMEIKETKKESAVHDISQSLSVAESTEINIQETKSEFTSTEGKIESAAVIDEDYREEAVVESKVQIKEPETQIEVSSNFVLKSEDFKKEEEFSALKIVKEVETEIESSSEMIEIEEQIDVLNINDETIVNKIEMSQLVLDDSNVVTERKTISSEIGLAKSITSKIDITATTNIQNYEDIVQESSFTARAVDKKLTLRTDLDPLNLIQGPPSTIDTPTPSTVPPTPLTDEYVFKLTIPLPKDSIPVPRDCSLSPQIEDPHIVKKKLIPHIETTIEKVVYDAPLPTPPTDKLSPIFKTPGLFGGSDKPIYKIRFPPIYRKPGLFGGADSPEYHKEEIREIERKSSLLASAIDQTIKSIEEYKEEVGMEKRKEKKYYQEYSEVIESKQNGFVQNDATIEEVIEKLEEINKNIEDTEVKIEGLLAKEVKEDYSSTETEREEVDPNGTEKNIIKTDTNNEHHVTFNENVNIEESIKSKMSSTEALITETVDTRTEKNEIKETTTDIQDISKGTENKNEVNDIKKEDVNEKEDPLLRVRPVVFDPESIPKRGSYQSVTQAPLQDNRKSPFMTESGEIIGTMQGIVDGLDDAIMDDEVARQIGKPGISEEKIAELISGEAEMLREAHVMGLTRVLSSHMHRNDDSSVDFQKIKPMIGTLKDSEVLKALNEELLKQKEEERKKEEKKWTTFLQKPKRPVPKVKFGYHGWTQAEQALVMEPYKVKIVKQAKPKVAPDYKPEDFETGPLPWEQRAELEASLPPVEAEEPILVPELPEYLEAVDPLKESEVPDLEDTGIPLPPPKEPTPPPEEPEVLEPTEEKEAEVEELEVTEESIEEKEETKEESKEDMDNKLANQLLRSVQGMVDPNAPVDQQLAQMRAQIAALAQLPEVIQQTLALVSQQLNSMSVQEARVQVSECHMESNSHQEMEVSETHETSENIQAIETVQTQNHVTNEEERREVAVEEVQEKTEIQQEEKIEVPQVTEEEEKLEKMKKDQQHLTKLEADARQLKQRSTPRVGKPKRMFGPPDPDNRPVVLPGGRRWRKTEDVYNEQMIAETLQAQAELIQGKAMGINFMKYEKPPVSLDHLQNSATYKMVHDMDQAPLKRVELLTPVIAEADYRERCRSTTPSGATKHFQIPQQFHP